MDQQETGFDRPTRRCDLVMKGGVTSGIIYPPAVAELARVYRFVNIGGTSAGAIAAALTAAAEYRRQRGDAGAFADLDRLPGWLSERPPGQRHSRLRALFRPDPETAGVFAVLLSALSKRHPALRLLDVLWTVLRHYFLAALIGAGLSGGGWLWLIGIHHRWADLAGLVIATFGAIAFSLLACVAQACLSIQRNDYGMCHGLARRTGESPPLAEWLTSEIERLAGRAETEPPLTFGLLEQAGIHLEMLTTCVSHGRPYRLPFDTAAFFFDPVELRRFFPERVVAHLVAHAPKPTTPRRVKEHQRLLPLLPLPVAADLPVVVATRLSLSFPLLISAVPLHAIDRTRRLRKADGRRAPARAERCWFSDGGICSNFPVHLFDQPLPRWPTFAINLRPFHPDYPRQEDESRNVFMPATNRAGSAVCWERFENGGRLTRLFGFLGAVISAMQGWVDNTQIAVPGYRDRVVHIGYAADEGGLNLDMDAAHIARLAERGRCAGRLLRKRFAGDPINPMGWDNHRWVRCRTTLALLETTLAHLADAIQDPGEPDTRSYRELLTRARDTTPRSYPFASQAQRDRAIKTLEEIHDWMQQRSTAEETLTDGAPRPEPELRIRPRI
ncbi:MAG: patatin-like phospholipase family protein [Vicinamibacteria bacterium]|jgi:predicted acylesterase/phospholipase RssA|nr:patatin-like phospholipase family protein [Vicinamibacteria bacterium]